LICHLPSLSRSQKKAKKASNKKKTPAAKKSKTVGKKDGGKTGKDLTNAAKGANNQGSKSGGKKKAQKRGAVAAEGPFKRGGRGRGRGRGRGSKRRGRGGARGGMTSTKTTRGGNRGRGRGRRRRGSGRGRGRGSGRKGQASSQLGKGAPERIVSQNEFYSGQQRAGRKKSFVRARPPALPHGLLFPTSKAKITIHNRPMSFRVKNDEYETEHPIEDLEYQITLENDEYRSAQHSLRSSSGRRPEKILKVEKSGGLFSHIMDSEYD